MKKSLLFLLGISAVCQIWATDTESNLTLAQVLNLAKEQNPDIAAARNEWEMSKAKVTAAKTWPDPEIGVEYWGFPRSSLNVTRANERWFDVAQTIPFPGKLTLKGK